MSNWPVSLLRVFFSLSLLVGARAASVPPPPADPGLVPPAGELTPAEEQAMWQAIQHNLDRLRASGAWPAAVTGQAVTYNFPVRMAPGRPDYAGVTVSAFSDHNAAAGQMLDYNGGARTYDGHQGTDYALWPFGWNKLQAGDVQVVAAAAGTVINNFDTNALDQHCGSGSSGNWNYVAVLHADGRLTVYGHLRHGSLTSKVYPQTVAQGEYLGTAASSGSSTGPHLHFEVRYGGFSNAEWTDPYAGPNSQAQSLWNTQRPYHDPAINRLATHASPPSSPDPCLPAIPNFQDSFSTPRNIYFYTYYRDYETGLTTQFNLYRPDGSLYQSWQDVPPANTFTNATSRAKVYYFSDAEPAGAWRFEAIYNGQTYQTYFNVNAPTAIQVTSPNGGEQWEPQQAHTIAWTDNLGGEVNIDLYRHGVYFATLAGNTPSDGEYVWTPGPGLAQGGGYSVRISNVLSPTVYDASDAPFAVQLPPNLSLSQQADNPQPAPGQLFHYVLVATNSGLGPASGARLTASLPAGMSPAGSASLNPPGLGQAGPPPQIVSGLSLAAGQSVTVSLPVRASWGQPAGGLITHTASLTSVESLTPITASVVITLADAPLAAANDRGLTAINTPIRLQPLDNDGDPNGDALTISALGQPLSGTVSLSGLNLVYTPTLGFIGQDVFTYTVRTAAEQASASVTVRVVAQVWRLLLPYLGR